MHKTFWKEDMYKKKPKKKQIKPKKDNPQKIRKKWIDECLKLWSLLIRNRDNYKCQWCHGSICNNYRVQAHHIVAKSITQGCKNSWFELENGVTLGYKCHFYRLKSFPDEYCEWRDKWMKENCPHTYNELRELFSTKTKTRLEHLKIIFFVLEKLCKEKGIEL